MRIDTATAFLASAFLGLAAPAGAQPYQFQEVIDGGTNTPGVNVIFNDTHPPVLDGGDLAFCGQSYQTFGRNGYYHVDLSNGDVTAIATDMTPSPSGGGNFSGMCITGGLLPSIDAGNVAFTASSSTRQGVYRWDDESVTKVVDDDTVFPDTTAPKNLWDSPSLAGRIAVTWGSSPTTPYFSGVYSFDLGGLFAVADTNFTPESAFFNVTSGTVNARAGAEATYVWHVNDSPFGASHVYRRRFDPLDLLSPLGPIELIASSGQPLPDEHFVLTPGNPQVDRSDPDQLCFVGGAPVGAIYRFDGTEVEVVADFETPIPSGTGSFTGFGLWCSIDAGHVVFDGQGAEGQWGVYRGRPGGALEKVVDTTNPLGGATAFQFEVSREAISHGRIAFRARIGSNDSIFVTPEPEASLAGFAVLALLAALQRRRTAGFASASRRATRASPRDLREEDVAGFVTAEFRDRRAGRIAPDNSSPCPEPATALAERVRGGTRRDAAAPRNAGLPARRHGRAGPRCRGGRRLARDAGTLSGCDPLLRQRRRSLNNLPSFMITRSFLSGSAIS